MTTVANALRTAFIALCLLLAACGGGGDDAPDPPSLAPPDVATATVGPQGGTVTGAGGGQVLVTPGALTPQVALGIPQPGVGAPALPAGATGFGPVLTLRPHGTRFLMPVLDAFGFADTADNVAVLPDGKIVLGRFATANTAGSGGALAPFTP